jgi:NlpC/P60 family putative phage cell wall peptidase
MKTISEISREWIGTPFRHQQSAKGIGCDCIGLARGVAREAGISEALLSTIPADYSRHPDGSRLNEWLRANLDPVNVGDLMPGDILVFKTKVFDHHVAIFTGNSIIHSIGGTGVAEHTYGKWALKNLSSAWRFRK